MEGGGVQEANGKRYQGAEDGRRVAGIGQPVLAQQADAGVRQAVQEILVLVGVIQRRLAVGHGEENAPQEKGERRKDEQPLV